MTMKSLAILLVLGGVFSAGAARGFDRDAAQGRAVDVRGEEPLTQGGYELLRYAMEPAGHGFEIAWKARTGLPAAVSGPRAGKEAPDPVARLTRALPRGVALRPESRRGLHTVLRYELDGRPIFPGVLTASVSAERYMLAGNFLLDGRVLNRETLGAAATLRAALVHAALGRGASAEGPDRLLFDTGHGLRHAHLYRVSSARPLARLLVLVDSESGGILYCASELMGLEGEGAVFAINPQRSPVTVEKLSNIARSGRLEGDFVKVENDDMMAASSSTNRFVYDLSSKHFDEAMAYYHVDRAHAFFKETFGFTALDSPMAVGVYYGDQLDNAYYMPWANCIVLGDGDRYNVLSRDATVIIHEYTHGVTYALAKLGVGGETAALGEGYSDYFASSITGDPRVGDWVVAKLGRPWLRNVENSKRYPEDLVHESHQDSLIWSGSFWDLRKAVGRETADALAFHSVGYLNSEATFASAFLAVLEADREKFAGVHEQAIREAFGKHGLASNDAAFRKTLRKRALYDRLER